MLLSPKFLDFFWISVCGNIFEESAVNTIGIKTDYIILSLCICI